MPTTTIKYFRPDDMLPETAHLVNLQFFHLSHQLEGLLPDSPEKSAGMRKLLEAKDCFIRAGIDADSRNTGNPDNPVSPLIDTPMP